jgi:glycosyltransferase involved in cell wall biosynthesis
MRLLITTQAVDLDDPALGFFHRWLEALAARVEVLEVICLKEGRHALPGNVRVHSLGKERGAVSRVTYAVRFYRALARLSGRYDAVFVHMNPEYVILAGPWWRLRGLRVVLWYTHRAVNPRLRLAALFASAIATAAAESLRLASPKVRVVGHGIDAAAFRTPRDGHLRDPLAIVSVGRITPIKRLEILIDALAILAREGRSARVTLIGEPTVVADHAYKAALLAQASRLGVSDAVLFIGSRPYTAMPDAYRANDLSVNLAPTGGIDKAVLESMASGCVPLVANRAFVPLLGDDADALVFDGTAEDLARRLERIRALAPDERRALAERLAAAAGQADISQVIGRIAALIAQ